MTESKKLREFGIILAIIFFIIGTINLFNGKGIFSVVIYILCLFLVTAVIVKPFLLRFPYRAILFISKIIGWVNTRLILCLIYYLVFSPVGIVLKLLRKDLLDRRFNMAKGSYWISCNQEFKSIDCERQF